MVDIWWLAPAAVDLRVLSAEECAQTLRFRVEGDAAWFAYRRAALRHILGRYVGTAPSDIRITRTCARCGHSSHGKPRFEEGDPSVSFSTASRRGLGIVAVADETMTIGVDLEMNSTQLAPDLAAMILTSQERDEIADSDPSQYERSLIRMWCRKEAVLKATGAGLVGSRLEAIDARHDVVEGWHVVDIEAPVGWSAALATAHTVVGVRTRSWSGARTV